MNDIYKREVIKDPKNKIEITMHEFKHGDLHNGSGGMVTNPAQAIAIALSQAHKYANKGK